MATSTDAPTFESRVTESCPVDSKQILDAAWRHDVAALKKLLDIPGKASCQDPTTGETPLHAAIRAPQEDLEAAKASVYELFLAGAIWNDVDDHNETPGCLALRLGKKELCNLCVDAGVRAELLFGLMEGYEALSSGDEDEEMEDEVVEGEQNGHTEGETTAANDDEAPELVPASFVPPKPDPKPDVNSEDYLNSHLSYSDGKLVDDEGNGVMMAWETDIMRRSVDALVPELAPGKKILNIGFGMGIIDSMFAATSPARHHIIEAHPEVLARLATPGTTKFGEEWVNSAPEEGAFQIHGGKWQEVCPRLLEAGETFDAIYFDTFGEDYAQLRMFFTEYVPGLLEQDGIFGFFNGLGADRKVVYDVYTKVVEMHLADAGLDVNFDEIDVDMKGLEEAGKGEWEGVRRRYWTLDKYRLPVCTFLG